MSRMRNYAALYLTLLLLLIGLAVPVESPEIAHLHSFSVGLHASIRIATDFAGNAYVTDTLKHQVCVLDASGELLRYISGIQISMPTDIAISSQNRIFVMDSAESCVKVFKERDNMNFSLANRYEYYPVSNP